MVNKVKKSISVGLHEAVRLTLERIKPLAVEYVTLVESIDRIVALDLIALVDSPSVDASLKDGYAVSSIETAGATPERPVRLRVLGSIAAGSERDVLIQPGTAMRILTGARMPQGADAVVREEVVSVKDNSVLIERPVEPGTEILPRGIDVTSGNCIIRSGQKISPGAAGLVAASGHNRIPVFKTPTVGIIGTGDEIIAPGRPLAEGKLYASNIVTLAGWCEKYRMKTRMAVVKDDRDVITEALRGVWAETDALVTSGGAWTGDHDIVASVLGELGWQQVFHRIRIGLGKAVGFGMLNGKPVFILPGGPPSNLMGFLQIALPRLLALSGQGDPGLSRITARLASTIRGRDPDWTDFVFGALEFGADLPVFRPLEQRSRLSSIAQATALASIPEGRDFLPEESVIQVQLLE